MQHAHAAGDFNVAADGGVRRGPGSGIVRGPLPAWAMIMSGF
jgi:hypothetical protein